MLGSEGARYLSQILRQNTVTLHLHTDS